LDEHVNEKRAAGAQPIVKPFIKEHWVVALTAIEHVCPELLASREGREALLGRHGANQDAQIGVIDVVWSCLTKHRTDFRDQELSQEGIDAFVRVAVEYGSS
jgi:hypothetical protein